MGAMKKIGLLGGMSWESSALYYQLINRGVRDRAGGLHSAICLMSSLDFAVIEGLQTRGEWDEAGRVLASVRRGRSSTTEQNRHYTPAANERTCCRWQRWYVHLPGSPNSVHAQHLRNADQLLRMHPAGS